MPLGSYGETQQPIPIGCPSMIPGQNTARSSMDGGISFSKRSTSPWVRPPLTLLCMTIRKPIPGKLPPVPNSNPWQKEIVACDLTSLFPGVGVYLRRNSSELVSSVPNSVFRFFLDALYVGDTIAARSTRRGVEQWQLVRLITWRSVVRVHPRN